MSNAAPINAPAKSGRMFAIAGSVIAALIIGALIGYLAKPASLVPIAVPATPSATAAGSSATTAPAAMDAQVCVDAVMAGNELDVLWGELPDLMHIGLNEVNGAQVGSFTGTPEQIENLTIRLDTQRAVFLAKSQECAAAVG